MEQIKNLDDKRVCDKSKDGKIIEIRKKDCIEAVIAAEQANLDAFNADTDRVEQFLALAKKYTDFSVLTTPMIYEFIEKIVVHAPKKIDGERTQEVEIYLKFIGKFDVPMPEPTPEELAEEARKKKERARGREKARRKRERDKAAREGAVQAESQQKDVSSPDEPNKEQKTA